MSFIQENIVELNIGLKREYKLIHVSDVHAITYRDTDSKASIEEAIKNEEIWQRQRFDFANGHHEHYDESHAIPSKKCLENIVNYINEEKPNGVVLTGDIIDYYTESNYEMLKDACGELNYPFVFACGNHETPVDRYEDITFNPEGFSVLEFNDFKIVSLDNSTKHITKETLECFKEELEDKKPIIIAMHIPLMTKYNKEEIIGCGEYFLIDENNTDDVTKEFIGIAVNNDLIKAILCGHVHFKHDSYFALGKLQTCCSSGLIGMINKIIVK